MTEPVANYGCQPSRLLHTIVDALQEDVLVTRAPTGPLRVCPSGADHGGDRIFAVYRDHAAPEFVVRSVERDRQVDRQSLGTQPLDEGHQADGRDGDPPGAEIQRLLARPAADRADHRRVIVERLAHPHEDHVGERAPPLAEVATGGQELVDDLGFAEVAVEARTAGRAEAAPNRTADL